VDELHYSSSAGVLTVLLRHDCDSELAGPLAAGQPALGRGRSGCGCPPRLLTASMLGDLQTICPLGVVLHSWESISRDAGENLLC
jgi:hypothetical protein